MANGKSIYDCKAKASKERQQSSSRLQISCVGALAKAPSVFSTRGKFLPIIVCLIACPLSQKARKVWPAELRIL
uniref:Uncharacterized protein n=1 Tax=Arundo donax TaxID=35708 RepID=A0A0A9HM12_ARUDO